MSDAAHSRARTIFFEAAHLPAEERRAFLESACGEDAGLRREVESLLAHHDPQSIIDDEAVAGEKIVSEPGARRAASTSGVGRLFKDRRRRRLWMVAAAILLGVLGLWTRARVEQILHRVVASQLTTVRDAQVQALNIWIRERMAQLKLVAEDPRVLPLVEELVEIGERGPSGVDDLKRAPARQALREIAESSREKTGNAGLAVLNDRGVIIFVETTETGMAVTATVFPYLSEALAGRTVFLRPYRELDLVGVGELGTMYTLFFTPVRNASGRVIAVLVSLQRAYGPDSISRILEVAQLGNTGETYAFDSAGMMLTESRFTDTLRAAGLAPEPAGEGTEWDAGAQLNVQIRDPGGDLLRGHEPELELGARPLTKLAALAVAARDKPAASDTKGILLAPYRNYRGVEVVGAWQWLSEHGFGVATEIEADEALAPLRILTRGSGLLVVLLSVFVAATLISTFANVRLRRRVQELKDLGPYHLISKIAQGGMGSVYLAEHNLLQRRTAVKILSGDLSQESIARFDREVRSTSRLTHPNTVEIYDFGLTPDGIFYYAMEYVEGPTLSELVARYGPLPPARTVHILKQVCGSLGEAHRAGIIHRDIKPQNIMLCERGDSRDVVKVLDFGLVKEVTRARAGELTSGHQIAGTPLYMAPERVTSPNRLDARVDVYSLGAVGYYLQTGLPIFEPSDEQELIHKVVNEAPERPSVVSPQPVPQELEKLIMDCLAKDPNERPQSVFEVVERLEALVGVGAWTQADATEWWKHHQVARATSPISPAVVP